MKFQNSSRNIADCFSKPKRRWTSELKNYSQLPNARLQSKVDYFITPYNRTIQISKHMEFEDIKELLNQADTKRNLGENKWGKLMNFITKAEKNFFRHSLHSINNGLYLELHNMIKKEVNKKIHCMEVKKACGKLNYKPRASILVPQILSKEGCGILKLNWLLDPNQKSRVQRKSGLMVKKKDISYLHNHDSVNANMTSKLLENAWQEKLNLFVNGLRKIIEEPLNDSSEENEEIFKSPLTKEINELRQRRNTNRKRLATVVNSPQQINQTKRAEVFFKEALARKQYKELPKPQR